MEPQSKGSVLLVEDHQDIAELVYDYMEGVGYELDYAPDGEVGINLVAQNEYDAIILDLMLPRRDGLSVCRELREKMGKTTPVLMLTARDTLEDKLKGFETGADDYLVKPFEIEELEARVRVLIKRGHSSPSVTDALRVGAIEFDQQSLVVRRDGQELILSPIGYRLLKILMERSPGVVSRQDIEREIWGDMLPDSDTLRSHMYNLRKVIDKPFPKSYLQTLPGIGYRLCDPDGAH
ncbi:MAG: response regulator transcription factor [Arenicellales bacterium]|jgi:DNA-binding response OmpR family regulator|nr:DNA-binding response regulator [Gammaproteobacteria bacterium]NDA14739.1 DNA-binding response regulator [Gammaproteobacteria bacterium]NDG44462.1 DNA-binding response regulator [Gammaproteobacteria bacterium]